MEQDIFERLGREVEPLSPMPPTSPVLICDEAEASKLLPLIDDDDRQMWPSEDCAALTWKFLGQWGASVDVAKALGDGYDLPSMLAMLAHEATHLALRHLRDLGEEDPAEEELAYHVEQMSLSLFEQFLEWLDGQKI